MDGPIKDIPECAAATIGTLIDRRRSLLLIIDAQDKVAAAVHDMAGVMARIEMLAEIAVMLGVPVHATEHCPEGLGRTVASLSGFLQSSNIHMKRHFSSVREPEFGAAMKATGRDQFIVVGMEAHVCVLQTCVELADAGRLVWVVADAVGSRNTSDRDMALSRMRERGTTLVSGEMVAFEWLENADHPQFKKVIALIK